MGIGHVESSPLTRSSYHARQAADAASEPAGLSAARFGLTCEPAPVSACRCGHTGAMGQVLDSIDDDLAAWIEAQPVFFVATAPSGADGHVNLSPKGYDTFRVLDDTTVAYLDLTGSGVETIAHLRENGRITVMFCAFEGPPRIVRLYGPGEVVRARATRTWTQLAAASPSVPGARAVIRLHVDRLSSSCGYSVPFMDLVGERPTLAEWTDRKDPHELAAYQAEKNAVSIDGLPGRPDALPKSGRRASRAIRMWVIR